jgi:hypothetical protein
MPIRVRYQANNREFGQLMMSDQTQDLADQGARAGVIEAQQSAMEAGLPEAYVNAIRPETAPPQVLAGNPRRTARVVARHRLAGVFEFGSGRRTPRPQGGSSPRYRILGQAGAKIGSPPFGGVG